MRLHYIETRSDGKQGDRDKDRDRLKKETEAESHRTSAQRARAYKLDASRDQKGKEEGRKGVKEGERRYDKANILQVFGNGDWQRFTSDSRFIGTWLACDG